MIVRTYGRRSRAQNDGVIDLDTEIERDDVVSDPFAFGEEEEEFKPTSSSSSSYYHHNNSNNGNKKFKISSQETLAVSQDSFNFTFSSQDSTRFVESDTSLQLIKPRKEGKGRRGSDGGRRGRGRGEVKAVSSLMETQECGEMMECVDEVDFAVDGLRSGGGGVRVRRASLLALLIVCGNAQQRRLLKAQGMAKKIVDALLDLSLDDSPSNLAAATLFYILTSDGQDSYLVDSSLSIQFLLKLLKPVVADAVADKAPSISQKLFSLRKDLFISQDVAKRVDSSPDAIIRKVLEILVSCKDLKTSELDNDDISRSELNPNWISLLTMEKACLSTISIKDTSGAVSQTGGNFKEKLRELGGLDAVFELAINFHSTLEGLIEHVTPLTRESTDGKVQCLPLLLKCLKIMENATFLSKENQSHLLRLKGNLAAQGSSLSFVKIVVNLIKILSELSLRRTSATSSPEMSGNNSNRVDHYTKYLLNTEQKDSDGILSSRFSQECSMGRYSSDTGLSTSQSTQRSVSFQTGSVSSNSGATRPWVGNWLVEKGISSSGSGSCSLISKSSDGLIRVNSQGSKSNIALAKNHYDNDEDMFIDLEDSQDPFAFDEDDCVPSKWDMVSGRNRGHRRQKRRPTFRDAENGCLSQPMLSQEDSASEPMFSQEDCPTQPMLTQEEFGSDAIHLSSDTSCTTVIDQENSNLVSDCLLTAIKVLMNLTNDNALGCQQIAACGGLEILSSLIARHFPSFSISISGERKGTALLNDTIQVLGSQTNVHFADQELDFLVTILGLLVNLVENDGDNRSRLAAAKVSLSSSGGSNEVNTGVIPLLCAIFLANRGAGEAAEDEVQSWDDEEVVLQGEKEAEKMIVEAYAALLLAFLSTESKSIRNAIANYLPDRNLKVLAPVLDRFVTFHLTLNMISPETHKTVSEVIESCRLP